jgi:hypothetical protein
MDVNRATDMGQFYKTTSLKQTCLFLGILTGYPLITGKYKLSKASKLTIFSTLTLVFVPLMITLQDGAKTTKKTEGNLISAAVSNKLQITDNNAWLPKVQNGVFLRVIVTGLHHMKFA